MQLTYGTTISARRLSKVCAYSPYPMKLWINGHERARRQASKVGIGFTELSNASPPAAIPDVLQAICERLGPSKIHLFAERWWSILLPPLSGQRRPVLHLPAH